MDALLFLKFSLSESIVTITAYRFDTSVYKNHMLRHGYPPEEILESLILLDDAYSFKGLKRMGLANDTIEYFLKKRVIKKYKPDARTATSLRMKDFYAANPGYKIKLVKTMQEGLAKYRSDPANKEKIELQIKKARKTRSKKVKMRRNRLLRQVILPNFGIENNGGYDAPSEIAIVDVVALLETEYSDFRGYNYRKGDTSYLSNIIYKEILGLGITPLSRSEILKRDDIREKISKTLKKRYKTDLDFRKKLLAALERGWETQKGMPELKIKRRENLAAARKRKQDEFHDRLFNLLCGVIVPEFRETEGGYEIPEALSATEVVDLLETPEYLDFVLEDYGTISHKRLLHTVWRYLQELGIEPFSLSESGEYISKKSKEKVHSDQYLLETLQYRMRVATETRMQLYEDKPHLKARSVRNSARTRKGKFRNDPEFRSMTQRNLAKGNKALWKKLNNDPIAKQEFIERTNVGLEKGRQKSIKRSQKRINALYMQVINREFDSLNDRIGQKYLMNLLNTKYKRVRDRYYSDSSNLESALKKDISRLRQDFAESAI